MRFRSHFGDWGIRTVLSFLGYWVTKEREERERLGTGGGWDGVGRKERERTKAKKLRGAKKKREKKQMRGRKFFFHLEGKTFGVLFAFPPTSSLLLVRTVHMYRFPSYCLVCEEQHFSALPTVVPLSPLLVRSIRKTLRLW